MIQQIEITPKSKSRGFHLVTSEILSQLPKFVFYLGNNIEVDPNIYKNEQPK